MIPLAKNTISNEEIDKLIDWLKTYPKLTKGNLTLEFEKKWSDFIGCRYSVFVNSGSSANLLMVYSLIENGKLKIGDKVIVPSLSWATSLAPFIQFGLDPILCDCNLEDLSVDINHFKELVRIHNPKCFMLVPILGFVPKMDEIIKICEENGIILLEDACESLGSKFQGRNLGTFGLMSSFSTYFGHHISTIEGGVICTNDRETANLLRSIRSHGWDRDMDSDAAQSLRNKHSISEFNSLYTFYHTGFNVRSTDLQAFLGINQLEKLPMIIENRNKNFHLYLKFLDSRFWKPESRDGDFVSNFAYPIIDRARRFAIEDLKKNGVECRPLLSGSLARQPYWYMRGGYAKLDNCDKVHDYGMYVPNNHELSEEEVRTICEIINTSLVK